MRYPFFDVRLVMLLLGVPDYMKQDKKIMREAMRGKLPEGVRQRPKTVLAGDLTKAKLEAQFTLKDLNLSDSPFFRLADLSRKYVNHEKHLRGLERYMAGECADSIWLGLFVMTPIALNNWLAHNNKLDPKARYAHE